MKAKNECGAKTFTVKVHQRDINTGVRLSHHGCPIAIAVKRSLSKKDRERVFVDGRSLMVGAFRYALPKNARVFVTRFDEKRKVKPLEFSAELVNDVDDYYTAWNKAYEKTV